MIPHLPCQQAKSQSCHAIRDRQSILCAHSIQFFTSAFAETFYEQLVGTTLKTNFATSPFNENKLHLPA